LRRLVLFDIDGTLLHGGPAKEAFHLALLEVYGTAGPIEGWEFSGKTDPQIARELLREGGVPDARIEEGFPLLWDRYLGELAERLPAQPTVALPGVGELLASLEGEVTVGLGLLTGNVARGAELKLGAAGLRRSFPVGAFGSDHEHRNVLPAIALERAARVWGVDFRGQEVVVVGDTPRDVECGRVHGLRTVAVATGRFSRETLAGTGADAVLDGFEDPGEALAAILG